jgi:hypothetical protein
MKQLLNHKTGGVALSARNIPGKALPALIAVALSGACSEAAAPTTQMPTPTAGTSGQAVAGSGGSAVSAGAAGVSTGGMPSAGGGAGGASTGGSSAGTASGGASAGTGGSSGGAGGGGSSAGGAMGGGGSGGGSEDGWVSLFNGMNLDGWTPGPTGAALFAADTAAGEPAIHVYPTQADQSNQAQATLRTNESYSSYVFHAEYKWGTKRFGGRAQSDRDNGICFHIVSPLPTNDQWPTSIEFQLGSQAWPGDWVSGNIFMLVDKTRAQWPYTTMNNQQVYSPTGTKKKIGAPDQYYKALAPSPNLNKGGAGSSATPATEWNVVELTVHGSKDATYNVNGTVVNGLTDMEYDSGGGNFKPLDKGPLALQAEFAEVYFRNIKIKVLP